MVIKIEKSIASSIVYLRPPNRETTINLLYQERFGYAANRQCYNYYTQISLTGVIHVSTY